MNASQTIDIIDIFGDNAFIGFRKKLFAYKV